MQAARHQMTMMKTFDELLNKISNPAERQFALFIFEGAESKHAHKQVKQLFSGLKFRPAAVLLSDPDVVAFLYAARLQAVSQESASLMNYNERRQMLDDVAKFSMVMVKAGSVSAAANVISAMRQTQQMTQAGAVDEFAHMTIEEMKQLAGER